ncbi:MAG: acyl-CoA dehydrogenase, partial [Acidobacteria bacterium]
LFANPALTQENSDPQMCRSLVKELGNAGLLRYAAPVSSVRDLCFLRYAIARETALGDLLFAMQGLGSYPIFIAGSEQQKQKYLGGAASGDLIAAFAMTEPQAGSDAASMSLQAKKDGDNYILNGEKTFISNAGLADFYTLFARTSEGSKGITAFLIESSAKGLHVQSQELVGVHPIGQLKLSNCVIPVSQRLGAEGEGLKIAYSTLDVFRTSVGAAAIGMAERAFREAVNYAKQRMQFGKPLAEFQAIQFKIAEMAQQLQASKLLVWDAATKKDNGAARITLESAIAKSFATEAAQQIIDQALQVHGGAGLVKGSITERLYRDIRALRIYEGTTEILKSVIAAQILKES